MTSLADRIRRVAVRLPDISDTSFAKNFDRFSKARIALIGEASHGTAEFYRARAMITKRLIEEYGFNAVAVEADWPDAHFVDRFVRLKPQVAMKEPAFSRFPTWMWRNTEVHDFIIWLQDYNSSLPAEKRTHFYGLDLYSLYSSINVVTTYLDKVDPQAATLARERYSCLSPWINDPSKYGLRALTRGYAPCEHAVVSVLVDLLRKRMDYIKADGEEFMDAEQNARLVADAEHYYRAMYYCDAEAWNLRDSHMYDTLERIMAYHGEDAKVVVWAHNSHIGDARFTGMGIERKEINVGQLCKERYGKDACLIGFGTHIGTVAAAKNWEERMEVMRLRPSRDDSYEAVAHATGLSQFLLDLRKGFLNDELRQLLLEPRLERFVGVIYRPETELWSHYSKAILPKQFDAYVWFDETTALKPLSTKEIHHAVASDETYPFGL